MALSIFACSKSAHSAHTSAVLPWKLQVVLNSVKLVTCRCRWTDEVQLSLSKITNICAFLMKLCQKKSRCRNPLEGYLGSEFPAICNRCGVMAACSHETLKIFFRNFCVFVEKRPLKVKFSKCCSESFHPDIDRRVVCKFCEIWTTGNRWNRALLTWQKNSPGSPAVTLAQIIPKICQGQPPTMYLECSRFRPNLFTFDRIIKSMLAACWRQKASIDCMSSFALGMSRQFKIFAG